MHLGVSRGCHPETTATFQRVWNSTYPTVSNCFVCVLTNDHENDGVSDGEESKSLIWSGGGSVDDKEGTGKKVNDTQKT